MLISEAKLFELATPYIEALELLVKAGKIPPQASFMQALPEIKMHIMGLAQQLQKPLQVEEPQKEGDS